MSKIRSKPDQIDLVNSYMANGNVNGEKKTFRCKTCESKNRQTFFFVNVMKTAASTHIKCVSGLHENILGICQKKKLL